MTRAGARTRALEEAIGEARRAVAIEEIAGGALAALERALRASGSLLYRYDARGALDRAGGSLIERFARYDRDVWMLDPTQRAARRLPLGTGVVLPVAVAGRTAFLESHAFRAVYRAADADDLMCIRLGGGVSGGTGATGATGILLTRSARARPFDGADVDLAQHAVPAFAEVVQRHARIAALIDERDAAALLLARGARSPSVVANRDGRVLFAAPRSSALMSPDATPTLRAELVDACRRFADDPSRSAAWTSDDSGRRIPLRLSLAPGARPSGAIVIELATETRPEEHDPELTRAESIVLERIARGASNAQVARELEVSIETVRTHVKRILSKLAVANRTQAALWWRARAR